MTGGGATGVALTGGIASGKSAVAQLLGEHGAVIVDSDVLAREVVEPGTSGLAAIVDHFGPAVLDADRLNRPALAEIVFADDGQRRVLESILHPRIRRLATEQEKAARANDPNAVVIQVIPLLVETGQATSFGRVVVVDVDPAVQLSRLQSRDGIDAKAAQARVAAQASRAERLAAATDVIDNSGSRHRLAEQVSTLWREVLAADKPG